MHFVLKQQEMC